ncbi:EamA family transporter [Streptomyces sp. NPDC098781]|uniref:EamA family transporter n=1 Tax=Streptomyces sp. NPDC098781 TaxID=3366097 RepID=UPI003824A437
MQQYSPAHAISTLAGKVPAPALVLTGVCGLQFGAALAPRVYPQAGAAGVVFLRLLIAGVILCALWRPRPASLTAVKGTWKKVLAAGALLAGHHIAFFEAVSHIPLGIVATIEFLGPFVIALAGSRRPLDLMPACLAAAGVFLLGNTGSSSLPVAGLVLAAAAASCWAGYILVSARMATRLSGGHGLAAAIAFAALLSAPYGIAHAGTGLLDPHVLWVATVVAVVSSVLPYSLNLEAMRRIPPRVFGVLTSLEPAAGALFGLLILGQHLNWPQWLGIAAVATASALATCLGAGKRRASRVRVSSTSRPEGGTACAEADLPPVN